MQTIENRINELHLGDPVTFRKLMMFPLAVKNFEYTEFLKISIYRKLPLLVPCTEDECCATLDALSGNTEPILSVLDLVVLNRSVLNRSSTLQLLYNK